jgi:hypothetical protein
VTLYASADGVIDETDSLVTRTTAAMTLKPGGDKKLKVAFTFRSSTRTGRTTRCLATPR